MQEEGIGLQLMLQVPGMKKRIVEGNAFHHLSG